MNPVTNWIKAMTRKGFIEAEAINTGDLEKAVMIHDAMLNAMAFADARHDRTTDEAQWCFAACFAWSFELSLI